MKKTKKLLILLTIAAMLISTLSVPLIFGLTGALSGAEDALLPGYEEGELCEDSEESNFELAGITTVNANFQGGIPTVTPIAYTASGYKTYLKSDATLKWKIANSTSGGYTTSSMQGMNVGTTYIYTAKIHNTGNDYATIFRTHTGTGVTTEMKFYASTTATSATSCNVVGHANSLNVVTVNNTNYLFALTGHSDDANKYKALARMQIDGDKLKFTGYFYFKNSSGSYLGGGAYKTIRHADGYLYGILKSGYNFYTCKIPDTATGGSASNPTAITCYKLFTIDTANAIFATSNSAYSTLDDLVTWINQDFSYSSEENTIYVPLFNGYNDNVILVYNVSGIITASTLAGTTNRTKLIFPSKLAFRVKDTNLTSFEIESTGFRTGQGTTGDKKLYFNTNSNAANEGIWQLSYQRNSYTITDITTSSSIIYTVKYEGNGGEYQKPTDSVGKLKNTKMNPTNHIKGIAVKLRPNYFVKSGYTFLGWYLTRQSDGKALYFSPDNVAYWYTPGAQPAGYRRALYQDGRKVSALTSVNEDVITCTAQWAPNTTATTRFVIRYDANGGTGSMADTIVTKGTSTATRANAFTKSGKTFKGWYAYRMSDNKWFYVSSTDSSKTGWYVAGTQPSGYVLYKYSSGQKVANTSSVNCDIVTFYAVWQ